MSARGTALCLVVLILAWPGAAGADTIRITGGSLPFNGLGGRLTLAGDRGFTFGSNVDVAGGRVDFGGGGCGEPCDPETTMSLGAFWSGNDLLGVAHVDGMTFDDVGGLASNNFAIAEFSGGMLVPRIGGLLATARARFAFDGLLESVDPEAPARFNLVGGGTATGLFDWRERLQAWELRRIDFQFERIDATPEPATVVLVATGAGAIIVRRRGKREAASSRQ